MTERTSERAGKREADLELESRYGVYEADDGSVMFYDDRNRDAWLRTDTAVDVRR